LQHQESDFFHVSLFYCQVSHQSATVHNQDPVSNWEISRNNKIHYQYQGNRNPFIDHPEYVGLIWGTGNSEILEPVSHASNFTGYNVMLSWLEPTTGVLPDAYLIRESTTGFSDIPLPQDGIPVETDANNKNVIYGLGHYLFKNATPGNTYYFKIFPYKGTGDIINYKTDGTIQQLTIQIN